MLKGNAKRPDILVVEEYVSPVVIETEVSPATTVEAEAVARLGQQLRTTGPLSRLVVSRLLWKINDTASGY